MRVLLVDDSVAIHKVAKLGLGAFPDSELRICDSVGQVDATIGDFAPQLCILSDTIVLNSEGSEKHLAKILKSKSNVLVLTESAASEDRLRAQGYSALLRKPFKLAEFRELVGGINSKIDQQGPAESVDDALPEVTLDLKALTLGIKNPNPKGVMFPSIEPSKRPLETGNREKAPALAPPSPSLPHRPATPALTGVATQARPRPQEMAPSLGQQPLESAVRAQVEHYLNQNWAMFTKSLASNVQKSVQQDRLVRQDAELQEFRQRINNELGSIIRRETEVALRSWMGQFSRDVLKEVAREELQKLLETGN